MELSPHHLSSSQRPLQRKAACSNTSGCLWFVFSKFYFISWSSESIYNNTLVLAGDQFRFRFKDGFFLPHLRNGNMSGCLLHWEMGDTKAPPLSQPLNPQEAPCFFGWNPPIRKRQICWMYPPCCLGEIPCLESKVPWSCALFSPLCTSASLQARCQMCLGRTIHMESRGCISAGAAGEDIYVTHDLPEIRPHRRCWGVIFRMALVKGYRFTWGGGHFSAKTSCFW